MAAPPSVSQQVLAFAALTLVSTAIGFTMKISQTGGRYGYNVLSVTAMTELFKLTSSTIIAGQIIFRSSVETGKDCAGETQGFVQQNFSWALLAHEVGLAFAYAVVNFVTFGVIAYAPASMFFLFKAASPVVTAIMLRFLTNRNVSVVQWAAVVMQMIGLIATQYSPECARHRGVSADATAVPTIAYVFIFINVAVACAAGVWNEHVVKTYGTSVNAQNMLLYSVGCGLNVLLFFVVPATVVGGVAGLSFFEGYSWGAFGVICANGAVGLVITAVYKYADVVVKTFGLAGSTVTLFALEASGVLPAGKRAASLSAASFCGTVVVFYAAYLYIAKPMTVEELCRGDEEKSSPLPDDSPGVPVPKDEVRPRWWWWLVRDRRALIGIMLTVATLLAMSIRFDECLPA